MTDKTPSIRIKTSKNKTICQKKRTYREIGTRFALPSSEVENRLEKRFGHLPRCPIAFPTKIKKQTTRKEFKI